MAKFTWSGYSTASMLFHVGHCCSNHWLFPNAFIKTCHVPATRNTGVHRISVKPIQLCQSNRFGIYAQDSIYFNSNIYHRKFIFMKTHKCGTSTVENIIFRYFKKLVQFNSDCYLSNFLMHLFICIVTIYVGLH